MALSKTTNEFFNTDVKSIIVPEDTENMDAVIDEDSMPLIIELLTALYSKPVFSTVREVISNAVDATVLTTDRKPVKISTPGLFSSNFVVEDFGVGMSPDDVKNIYRKYGKSTKKLDMSQIGSKGLGAKAPLAYCDEFYITTTKDGITTELTMAKSSAGTSFKNISYTRSGKPNGTTVTVPVNNDDRREFSEAINVYKTITPDVALEIDGNVIHNSDKFIQIEDIVLDKDDNVTGRVWVRKDLFADFLINIGKSYYDLQHYIGIDYVLSGWVYQDPTANSGYYYNHDVMVYVELKPGVVDFASSRDEITLNNRFKKFKQSVFEQVFAHNTNTVDKLMEVYKELNNQNVINFAKKVASYVDMDNDKTITINPKDNKPFVIDYDKFENKDGFNPFYLMRSEATKEKTVYSVAMLSDDGYMVTYKAEKNNRYYDSDFSRMTKNVSEQNKKLLSIVGDNNYLSNFINILKSSYMSYANVIDALPYFKNITVVVDADEDFVETFIKGRTTLSKHGLRDQSIFFANKKLSDEFVENLNYFGTTVEYLDKDTLVDLIAKGRAIDKANRVPKQKVKTEKLSVVSLDLLEDDNREDVLKSNFNFAYKAVDDIKTFTDAMNNKSLILIVPNTYSDTLRSVFYGVINRGVNLDDFDTIDFFIVKQGYAEYVKELKDYENVYVHKEVKYKAKAFEDFAKDIIVDADFIEYLVREQSDEDLVKYYAQNSIGVFTNAARDEFLKYLPENSSVRIFLEGSGKSTSGFYSSSKELKDFARSLLVERYDDNFVVELDNFINIIKEINNNYYNYDGTVVRTALFSTYENTVENSMMFSIVIKTLVEKITA